MSSTEAQRQTDDRETARFLDAWLGVRQVIQAANFNRFHKAGLSATQFMILNLLPENRQGITMGLLATRANLAPATIARTVDSLEKRKMVAREKSADDGRRVMVKITKQGQALQNAAAGKFRNSIARMFQAMPAADRQALITGLESLLRASAQTPRSKAAGQSHPTRV